MATAKSQVRRVRVAEAEREQRTEWFRRGAWVSPPPVHDDASRLVAFRSAAGFYEREQSD